MMNPGSATQYKITFKTSGTRPPGNPHRDVYLVQAYDYPTDWEDYTGGQRLRKLMPIRLKLRQIGEEQKDMAAFSFWPDTIMIKAVGDPLSVAGYHLLDRRDLTARVIVRQGPQNPNHEIDLYACHLFFMEGYATMTTGENTSFIQNREFLMYRVFTGYRGDMSDSRRLPKACPISCRSRG